MRDESNLNRTCHVEQISGQQKKQHSMFNMHEAAIMGKPIIYAIETLTDL